MTGDEARKRFEALGFAPPAVDALLAHFEYADAHGKTYHGLRRASWLETLGVEVSSAVFDRVRTCDNHCEFCFIYQLPKGLRRSLYLKDDDYRLSFLRWDGHGALGYLVLEEVVRATLADPPERARVIVARRCFPTGVLGYWVGRLADGGLVAAMTATSPRRLPPPEGGQPLTGTNPLAIAIPSSDARSVVADVSMGAVTHGAVLAGEASPEELVPFGGEHAHKAFALAIGLELRSPGPSTAPCWWSRGPTTTPCLRYGPSPRDDDYPATVTTRARRPRSPSSSSLLA